LESAKSSSFNPSKKIRKNPDDDALLLSRLLRGREGVDEEKIEKKLETGISPPVIKSK
jgi:hypothetical protein